MNTTMKDVTDDIKTQAEHIVASGDNVRPRLAEVVAQAACAAQESGKELVGLIGEVLEGARSGLDRAVPQERDNALRQVVDALGDAFSRTALAAELAVKEAVGSSRHFANKDLTRLRDDFTAVRALFSETVGNGMKACTALTAEQVSAARIHAGRVADSLGPAFTRFVDAVRQHPVTFARDSLQAGVGAGQGAAASLLQAVGRMLEKAGDELRRPN